MLTSSALPTLNLCHIDTELARLDAELQRCNEATAGPWKVSRTRTNVSARGGYTLHQDQEVHQGLATAISRVTGTSDGIVELRDAAFIATARTAYPDLLLQQQTVLRALRAVVIANPCDCRRCRQRRNEPGGEGACSSALLGVLDDAYLATREDLATSA